MIETVFVFRSFSGSIKTKMVMEGIILAPYIYLLPIRMGNAGVQHRRYQRQRTFTMGEKIYVEYREAKVQQIETVNDGTDPNGKDAA